eukprot:688568-Pleurochrysis_carterae.AAC.2
MDCVWKAENEGVPKTVANGSGRKRISCANLWMKCQASRAKLPTTSKMSGVTTCPRRSASWYFACWNAGTTYPMM